MSAPTRRAYAEAPPATDGAGSPTTADISQLRARRREARRRSRLARLDLGLGVTAAIVLLLASPGLAMTAVIALVLLALCILSVVLERRSRRRRARRGVRRPTQGWGQGQG